MTSFFLPEKNKNKTKENHPKKQTNKKTPKNQKPNQTKQQQKKPQKPIYWNCQIFHEGGSCGGSQPASFPLSEGTRDLITSSKICKNSGSARQNWISSSESPPKPQPPALNANEGILLPLTSLSKHYQISLS
jgi:hypothetical protein